MRRKHGWLRILLLLGLWVVPPVAQAAEGAFKFWLILNEPLRSTVSGNEQEELDTFFMTWAKRGIDLSSRRDKARHDGAFARALLSQRVILEELAAFRANQPAFPPIEVTFFTWEEYFASLKAAMHSPQRPHLFEVPSSWCASLVTDVGLLAPVPQELDRQAKTHSLPQLLAACRLSQKGPLYALPWLVDVRLLFFWRDIFPTLEVALQQGSQAPETFQQALRQAKTHWSPDRPLFAFPTARDLDLLHQTALLIWGHGGELVQRTWWPVWRWHSAVFRDEALLGALFVKRLVQEDLATLPRVTREVLEQEFLVEQLGSLIAGPWLIPRLQARLGPAWDTHVGLALPPLSEGDAVTFLGGSLLGLSMAAHESQRLQEAQTLATYLTQGTSALTYGRAVGKLPASRPVLGTAEDAISARAALREGMPPATYFEALVSRSTGDTAPRLLEKALQVGRTYPAISVWATKLEVPSVLTSLYHLWQDLAANETERGLRADVAVLVHDWNEALAWIPPWVFWFLVVLLSASGGTIVGLYRHAQVLAAKVREITQKKREIEEVQGALATLYGHLERTLADLAGALQQRESLQDTVAPLHVQLQKIADLLITTSAPVTARLKDLWDFLQENLPKLDPMTARLEDIWNRIPPRNTCVNGGSPKLQITLPRRSNSELILTFAGQETTLTRHTARLVDYLIRESLLEGQRDFSLLLGYLLLWTDSAPTDLRNAWEREVAAIRKSFAQVGWPDKVIPWGKRGSYLFGLGEAQCDCYVSVRGEKLSYIEAVRSRYQKARMLLRRGEMLAALEEILEAYQIQAELQMQDLPVLLLLLRIKKEIDMTGLPSEQQLLLAEKEDLFTAAQRELHKYQEAYEHLLSDAALEAVKRALRIEPGHPLPDDISEQWQRFEGRLQSIKEELGVSPPLPIPVEFAQEWEDARQFIANVRQVVGTDFDFDTWWRHKDTDPQLALLTDLYTKMLTTWHGEPILLPLRMAQEQLNPDHDALDAWREYLEREVGTILWEKLTATPTL